MSYSLHIAGHAPDEETERRLADKLSEILSDPQYGVGLAQFGGSHVSGDLRTREGWLKS